jgi:hypothetical protein
VKLMKIISKAHKLLNKINDKYLRSSQKRKKKQSTEKLKKICHNNNNSVKTIRNE